MTDHNREEREALIKKAAEALAKAQGIRSWSVMSRTDKLRYGEYAAAVIAVFEQAHTLTSDDLASGTTEDGVTWTLSRYDGTFWLSVDPEGFRRPEVPNVNEPGVTDISTEQMSVSEPQAEPTDAQWLEQVNSALWKYDQGSLDVRGVASALRAAFKAGGEGR